MRPACCSALATYLLCLKRYLLNGAPALRARIMITVHLDELHVGEERGFISKALESTAAAGGGRGGDSSSLRRAWKGCTALKESRAVLHTLLYKPLSHWPKNLFKPANNQHLVTERKAH